MNRFRITYSKTEALRYTGNLDIQKIWERYLRRANLPVAYSQGFHPQPRIQQACPLPLGFLSFSEQTDIFLDDELISTEEVKIKLESAPYPGIEIGSVDRVEITEPSLASRVLSAQFLVEFFLPPDFSELTTQIESLLGLEMMLRCRRNKEYDLRPLIEILKVQDISDNRGMGLLMQLAARQSATGRPEEVVSALGLDPFAARYTRLGLIYSPLDIV